MRNERWRRLEELYDAAAELSPPDRERFLDEQCQGDEELRRELTAMLGDAGSGFTKAVEHAAAAVASDPGSWPGRKVGPYRIVRLIGQGGMGAVYEGVREDAFQKRVAIKLVKYTFDSEFARRRFEQERQILARLEHPNIARLLDGGDYEGLPYLVMEFVEGGPLLAAVKTLDIRGRLRVFRQILSAVSFAHRNLIVHRDLKPANILISGSGEPKLLDFGIARLIEEDTAESGTPTMTVATMMTPDYASPEQVKGESVGVASDIYSLGAILFEVLCGAKPHRLESYSTAEIYRAICETEPRAPSAEAADPHRQRALRGDLDTLVLHAMAKDPAARYLSAEAFSAEIERFLNGRPLTVRPASALERGWKFVKRNRLAVGAGLALVVTLFGGITASTIEARRAQRRFDQVRELANTFLFQFYDQVTPLAGSTAVRASIVDTARKYLDGLSREAGNDHGLILELAQAYQRLGAVQSRTGTANLGQVEDARRNYQRALDLYARLPVKRESSPDLRGKVADVLYALNRVEYNANREDAAEPFARRMLDLLGGGSDDAATRMRYATGERGLGDIRVRQGRVTEALTLMESSRQTLVELRSSGFVDKNLPLEIATTEEHLARTKVFSGDLDGALSTFLDLLRNTDPCSEHAPPGNACRVLAVRLSWTADVYGAMDRPNLGEPEKAAVLYQQALQIQERIAPQDAQDRQARFDLAARYGKLGDAVWTSDPKRAINLYDRALATAQALASKEQVTILRASYLIAITRPLVQLGRTAEARRVLSELSRLENAEPPSTAYADRLGEIADRALWPPLLLAEGKRDEARRALEKLIQDTEKLRSEKPTDLTPVFLLSNYYRDLAATYTGEQRRQAFLRSAGAWHSWPATSFTRREEQRDLAAASR
jgi:tRNA A-37 threonylcarbamoyl transferase component Bud32/tetratricopeptide (TPR) repeat protein